MQTASVPHRVVSGLRLAACLTVLAACSSQLAAQNYWQQQVDYTIDVSLNDTEHTLDGFSKIQYTNHSPDTLSFIWFHLWPNAYRNDRTAFSEQLLGNGRTDFYFSSKEQKGYINRLDFRADGVLARMEDHPQYIDIVKIILPQPLPPGGQAMITTPFHEQLPFNFSRGGHVGRTYQLTQWYPKPAVYDRQGWHPMPYLDQGEFYSEYGNFDVRITLPENYVVAATGELQNPPASASPAPQPTSTAPPASSQSPRPNTSQDTLPVAPKSRSLHAGRQPTTSRHHPAAGPVTKKRTPTAKRTPAAPKRAITPVTETASAIPMATKTLRYTQNNIHDFALFASKHFQADHDTLQLASGRIVDVWAYYSPEAGPVWKNSVRLMKRAIRFRSALIGEYPFNIVSAAEVKMGVSGGMEYPTITAITPQKSERSLDIILEHEIGHNWFYGVLGTNERRYPWMDEGVNTYYDKRYEQQYYGAAPHAQANNAWLIRKIPADLDRLFIDAAVKQRLDQPISTSSEEFTAANYELIAYSKTSLWMRELERRLGSALFDSCMQTYFRLWQFKHPSPEDFRSVIEGTSHQQLDTLFALLDEKGPLRPFNRTDRAGAEKLTKPCCRKIPWLQESIEIKVIEV